MTFFHGGLPSETSVLVVKCIIVLFVSVLVCNVFASIVKALQIIFMDC